MSLSPAFAPKDICAQLELTNIQGRHLNFIDDLSPSEVKNLFVCARMFEPFWRSGLELLKHRILCTLFFQPSTRTRFSHETAMYRLGGSVLTESNPLISSSAAKNESLYDSLRVISQYADVIVLRHPDEKHTLTAIDRLKKNVLPKYLSVCTVEGQGG